MNQVSVIIPAAGAGSRFGEEKQFKLLGGRPLLFYCLQPFIESSIIQEVIVVVPGNQITSIHRDLMSMSAGKPITVIAGGVRRQDSVGNGVSVSSSSANLICIHDAARPFVTENMIANSISACENYDGAVVALPSRDTVKLSNNGLVKETLDRRFIWLAQTPQTFNKDKLVAALENADQNDIIATDEATLMEVMGFSIALVEGHPTNFKITTRDDWERAEQYLLRKTQ